MRLLFTWLYYCGTAATADVCYCWRLFALGNTGVCNTCGWLISRSLWHACTVQESTEFQLIIRGCNTSCCCCCYTARAQAFGTGSNSTPRHRQNGLCIVEWFMNCRMLVAYRGCGCWASWVVHLEHTAQSAFGNVGIRRFLSDLLLPLTTTERVRGSHRHEVRSRRTCLQQECCPRTGKIALRICPCTFPLGVGTAFPSSPELSRAP